MKVLKALYNSNIHPYNNQFYFLELHPTTLYKCHLTCLHAIDLSLIVPRNSGNRANPENDSP